MLRARILGIACLTLLAGAVAAQERSGRNGDTPVPLWRAEYAIKADIRPDSSLIRCSLGFTYRNLSPDTIRQLYLQVPPGTQMASRKEDAPQRMFPAASDGDLCVIDSISFDGVPIRDDSIVIDSSVMRLRLRNPLPPRGSAYFLIVFSNRMKELNGKRLSGGELSVCAGWYPSMCVYREGKWLVNENLVVPSGEMARFEVVMSIDSAYTIAAPGEFVNEKLHFGYLPPPGSDTLLVNITGTFRKPGGEPVFRPIFEGGRKTYAWRLDGADGFSFAVGKNPEIDRLALNDVTIESYYESQVADSWQRTVIEEAADDIALLDSLLGRCPESRIVVVHGELDHAYRLPGGMIVVPDWKSSGHRVQLALGLVELWFPPLVLNDSICVSVISKGLAANAAYGILTTRPGMKADDLATRFLAQGLGLTAIRPHKDLQQQMLWDELISVPAWCHMLQVYLGDSLFWSRMKRFVRESRTSYPTLADCQKTLAGGDTGNLSWFFDQWRRPVSSFDYKLKSAVCWDSGGSFVTETVLDRGGSPSVPVQIAYVLSPTDTIVVSLPVTAIDTANPQVTLRQTTDQPVQAVVADPHATLPDVQRGNNCIRCAQGKVKCKTPISRFPAYRLLEGL
jgi:hypothetical protein